MFHELIEGAPSAQLICGAEKRNLKNKNYYYILLM